MERFDKNRDGLVSRDEFMRVLAEIKASDMAIAARNEHEASAAMYNSASEYQGELKRTSCLT